jgi:hypothetical protein
MRNFGKKSLDEIKERLAARGLIEAPVRDESENGTVEDVEDLTEADDEVDELRGETDELRGEVDELRGDAGERRGDANEAVDTLKDEER